MKEQKELPARAFKSQKDWEAWLERNHDTPGVWIKLSKKGSGIPSVSYQEAVDSALCYGWIDGQARSLDDVCYLQRFTPRTSTSNWSKINREKAEAFLADGRMRASGLRAIEVAKANGRWEKAYEGQREMAVPEDFEKALKKHPKAQKFFGTLDSKSRYAVLYRIQDARKPETRARRIESFIAMLAEGKKIS
ncbi:MAG TPA: YdeI/OmpD-associated family protein [Gemmatimonadaceae bacterium]|nr:YdeI/OmpD-associated family protein [Gemmatimonadaceae bacterium]